MNPDIGNKLYQFLQDTAAIYEYVRSNSILAEQKLPDEEAPIHAANELKSMVFHFYHIVRKPELIDEDLLEAKEHLYRAFYDLHQITMSAYLNSIIDKVSKYEKDILSRIFPDYYKVIFLELKNLQRSLATLRSNRNTHINNIDEVLLGFQKQLDEIDQFESIVLFMIPELDIAQQEKNEKEEKLAKENREREEKRERDALALQERQEKERLATLERQEKERLKTKRIESLKWIIGTIVACASALIAYLSYINTNKPIQNQSVTPQQTVMPTLKKP